MFQKSHGLHRQIRSIEKFAQDDFALLREGSSKYHPTTDLHELHGKWKERRDTYFQLRKVLYGTILISCFSFLLLISSIHQSWSGGFYVSIGALSGAIPICVGLSVWIHKLIRSEKDFFRTGQTIRAELFRRFTQSIPNDRRNDD